MQVNSFAEGYLRGAAVASACAGAIAPLLVRRIIPANAQAAAELQHTTITTLVL
jgi:hypothetical protein